MKTVIACVLAIVLGVSAGVGTGFLSYADPGPDFEWMNKPLVYETPSADLETGKVQSIDVVDGEEFDFGIMDRGETREHTFVIRNNTQTPMYPKVTGTTCKCTVGDLEDSRIGPGEEGKVKLEWVAKSLDTEFRQTATIDSGNEIRPDIALSVFGRVIQMVDARPRRLVFGDVSVQDEHDGQFVVYAFKDERLTIVEETWSDPETQEFFDFEWQTAPDDVLEDMADATSAVICKVTMKPGLPMGRVYQELQLKTSSSKAGMIEIPVIANIVGDISITGSRFNKRTQLVQLGPVQSSSGMETKISLIVKGKFAPEFKIEDVEVDPDDEKVLLVEVDETRNFSNGKVTMVPVRISVPPGAQSVNYSGGERYPPATIKLKTNHPDAEELTLSVVFSVVK